MLEPNTSYDLHIAPTVGGVAPGGALPEGLVPHTLPFDTKPRAAVALAKIDAVASPSAGSRDSGSADISVAAPGGASGSAVVRILGGGGEVLKETPPFPITSGAGAVRVDGIPPSEGGYEAQAVGISVDSTGPAAPSPRWDSPEAVTCSFQMKPSGTPSVSSVEVDSVEQTSAVLRIAFSSAGGVHYLVRPGPPKAADAEDVETWGTQVACATPSGGVQEVVLEKLHPDKDYSVAVTSGGADAPLIKAFRTKEMPPPESIVEWLQVVDQTDVSGVAEYSVAKPGMFYWAAVPDTQAAPTSQEVKSWKNNPPQGVVSGVEKPRAEGKGKFTLPNLKPGSGYHVYAVTSVEAALGNPIRVEEFRTEDSLDDAGGGGGGDAPPGYLEAVQGGAKAGPSVRQPTASTSGSSEEEDEEEDETETETATETATETETETLAESESTSAQLPKNFPNRTFAEEERDPIGHTVDISCISQPQYLKALFNVTKYNPDQTLQAVSKRERVWVLDFFDRTFTNLPPLKTPEETLVAAKGKGAKSLSHKKLFRCERDLENLRRVRVKFFGVDHPYDLLFESVAHRQRFYECTKALRNGLVWAPSLCPALPGPHCFSLKIRGETSAPVMGSLSGRQHLKGNTEIKVSNVPCDETKLWVGTIDLQSIGLPRDLDFSKWMPHGQDVYVVGFVDVPTEYQGTTRLLDKLVEHVGEGYVPLISTEREPGKRTVALVVVTTSQKVSKVSNTEAWTGQHTRKSKKNMSLGKALSSSVTDAVAVSFSLNETPVAFVCTKVRPMPEEEDDPSVRNDIMRDLLMRVQVGLGVVDISVRFHHLFILGSLAYGFDGEPEMVTAWERLSAMPPTADVLQMQIEDRLAFVDFVEGDLELVQEFREFSLEQRVLSKSYPGLELENISYKAFNVGSGRHAVASVYNFKAQLVFLETFANPPPAKVSFRLDTCMLTCQTVERQSLLGRVRGASRMQQPDSPTLSRKSSTHSQRSTSSKDSGPRRKSIMSSLENAAMAPQEEYELSGKPGLQRPYCLMFAEFAEGAYRTGVMQQDENTGLPATTECPVMVPSTHAELYLERQFLLFSVKNDAGNSPTGRVDMKKGDYFASAVLPLKNVLISQDGRASFCIPLYYAGTLSGGTLTGIMRLSRTEQGSVQGRPEMASSSEIVVETVFEMERRSVTKRSFDGANLQPKDPPAWCNEALTAATPKGNFILPPGWIWQDDWRVHVTASSDADGWQYAENFKSGEWTEKNKFSNRARRRKWIRTRVLASKGSATL
eukprot:TRINITY_DN57835_c0_g1_i1.p1 TRINITY_DN57835_c0_g1~~TRINITY_DN57835_c0_g1_i1.p1  ORF type:complete len:1279 (+),score=446.55 TRINITY_DN57835_c0_g1_i1:33-3839(+)